MCGIFSLLNSCVPENIIEQAFQKGADRGPESSVISVSGGGNMVMGFHRLAINGLTPASNQPFIQENIKLICNGEIYNYQELYRMLDIEPKTGSDCEIIIHLYIRFGIERTLALLDGVFAFVLLDYDIMSDTAKVFVARDPFGVRPLYMCGPVHDKKSNTDMYGFASEMKCLIDIGVQIRHFLPGTYSIFELGFQVCASWKPLRLGIRYHSPGIFTESCWAEDYSWIGPMLKAQLIQAVHKRCLCTERPIACLLSGGLDSSLVAALVASHYTRPIETYSIGLAGSTDLVYARMVADHIGSNHTEVILTEREFIDAIPEVIEKIESYDTTTVRASIGNYLLAKYIREHSSAKVIFNGDGADELMGGYLYCHKAPNAVEFDEECRRLLADIHLYDVLRSDKSISSNGLEPRTPFLDRTWVQAYLSVPATLRCHSLNGQPEKYLVRQLFSGDGLLPQDVLWRRKEAFSDGVSDTSRSLYQIIQEYVETVDIPPRTYFHNAPTTKEQAYYRWIFETKYPGQGLIIPYFWMPRFVEGATDASARTLKLYHDVAS